jgi:hypothetical protein
LSNTENDRISPTFPTGVAQVLNRLDGKPFDDADQRLFEVKKKNYKPRVMVESPIVSWSQLAHICTE